MPFGSFFAREKSVLPKVKKKSPAPEAPARDMPAKPQPVNSTRVNILLIGRSMTFIREFLCSMNQNMSQAMHKQGMTFYTRELESISDMVAMKKKLEQFFWTFSDTDWTYPAGEEAGNTYTFSISPSGNQKRALDFVISCVVPGPGTASVPEHADVCWVLADGLLFDDSIGGDPYEGFAAEAIKKYAEKPVCLILAQLEKWGHFEQGADVTIFPKKTGRMLTDRCADKFASVCGTQTAVIFTQIYGGLEYVGADENGKPKLHIGQDGFYQSYIPENCEIPGFYTIQTICANSQTNFFADASGRGLNDAVRSHYAQRFGNAGWKPEFLVNGEARV